MDRIKKKWNALSLKKAFMLTVLFYIIMTAVLSAVTIFLCLRGRKILLPNPINTYVTREKEYSDGSVESEQFLISTEEENWKSPYYFIEGAEAEEENGKKTEVLEDEAIIRYSVSNIENGYSFLTPKRKAAYRVLGVAMFALPAFYVILGILICAAWFYRHKLSKPIQVLEHAIGQIQKQDLEFTVEVVSEDELGRVCSSFEEMRSTLYRNNQSMWNMLEERKQLQASIAHDLRNPITIIQSYVEYWKLNLKNGNMTENELEDMVDNVQITAKRLENYTDSIRDISKLEELALHMEQVNLNEVLMEMKEELGALADCHGKQFLVHFPEEAVDCETDVAVLFRILENLVANASRYATETIRLHCSVGREGITFRISDDGPGFPEKYLSGRAKYFARTDAEDGHMGMGLSICRILCRKLGGTMKYYNQKEGGAEVMVFLKT